MLLTLFVFIILTLFFLIAMNYVQVDGKCPKKGEAYFDGNGVKQWRGRGYKEESVEVLLQRIDWLAKKGDDKNNYAMAYILAYLVSLGLLLVLYGYSGYIPEWSELIVIVLTSYLVLFSVDNLLNFHTHRYPYYYIRNNTNMIQDKLGYYKACPPKPDKKSSVPHRTIVRDIMER